MAILRDIVAQFAIQVDMRPLTELDKQINKVNQSLKTIGTYAAAGIGATGAALWKLTEYGSHANETFSALKATYKEDQKAVLEWSNETAKIMNRSTFDMQESVLKFGAFLGPVFKESGTDEIAAMSEELTKLSVDLAAFYDTSDEDAVMRLFSGMSGETEAVRRLGIDISDTTLEDMNKNLNGDPRTMRALTLEEKARLRLQKIMMDTVDKQGQAVKESHEWAGQLKAAQSRLKDIAVVYGRRLIPFAKKMLGVFRSVVEMGVRFYENLENIASNLRAAVVLMGAIGLGWVFQNREAIKLVLQMYHLKWAQEGFYKSLLKSAGQAAAMVAAFYVIEDIITFLRGGESVFGEWMTVITGIERPMHALERSAERWATHIGNAIAYLRDAKSWLPNALWGQSDLAKQLGAAGTAAGKEDKSGKNFRPEGYLSPDAADRQRKRERAEAINAGDIDKYMADDTREAGTSPETAAKQFMRKRGGVVQELLQMARFAQTPEQMAGVASRSAAINLNEADVETGTITDNQVAGLKSLQVTFGDINVKGGITNAETAAELKKVLDQTWQDKWNAMLREEAAAQGEEE